MQTEKNRHDYKTDWDGFNSYCIFTLSYKHWYLFKLFFRFYQCCGAGVGRSRGFLAGAGADLKFELEPEPIFLGRL